MVIVKKIGINGGIQSKKFDFNRDYYREYHDILTYSCVVTSEDMNNILEFVNNGKKVNYLEGLITFTISAEGQSLEITSVLKQEGGATENYGVYHAQYNLIDANFNVSFDTNNNTIYLADITTDTDNVTTMFIEMISGLYIAIPQE